MHYKQRETRMYGYRGKIMHVDLSNHSYSIERPAESFYRTYGGGRGLIAYYLLHEVPAHADALGPDNILIFATGPATGLPISGAARHSVGAKSPLTNGYGDGESGGFWGHELKSAGWDAIVIHGRAARPEYLWIHDDSIEFRSANGLWGLQIYETEQRIREELKDDKVHVASIGPAGEQLSRIACILNDGRDAAGRAGLGAVMGSKNLKAIVTRGSQYVEAADQEQIRQLARWIADNKTQTASWLLGLGTGQHLDVATMTGNLPLCNFRGGVFAQAPDISAESFERQGLIGRMEGCFACALRCKKVRLADSPADVFYGGPEYETIAAMGSNCGIGDPRIICEAQVICNANGLDTISAGGVVSFAMECFERGILTTDDTGGLSLRWGNEHALLTLLGMIVRREGLGAVLADGVRIAAQRIGHGSEAFAIEVKGQSLPMHEPRLKNALGLGYAVSPTGADHGHNIHDTSYQTDAAVIKTLGPLGVLRPQPSRTLNTEKVRLFTYALTWRHLLDVLDICSFVGWPVDKLQSLVNAATGWNTTTFELMKIAERAVALTRVFNLREGWTAADDRLPERFFQPHPDGVLSDKGLDPAEFAAALASYYGMMGWDRVSGIPTIGKLEELNIGWAASALL